MFDQEDGTIGHLVDREIETTPRARARRLARRSTTEQHQGSISSRRRSSARPEQRPELSSRHVGIDDRSRQKLPAMRSPASKTRSTASSGRPRSGRSSSRQTRREVPRREGFSARRGLRIIDIKDSTFPRAAAPCAAYGSDWCDCTLGLRALQGRPARGIRVRRARASSLPQPESVGQRQRAVLSVLPDQLPSAIEKLQKRRSESPEVAGGTLRTAGGHEAAGLASSQRKLAQQRRRGGRGGWDANG